MINDSYWFKIDDNQLKYFVKKGKIIGGIYRRRLSNINIIEFNRIKTIARCRNILIHITITLDSDIANKEMNYLRPNIYSWYKTFKTYRLKLLHLRNTKIIVKKDKLKTDLHRDYQEFYNYIRRYQDYYKLYTI